MLWKRVRRHHLLYASGLPKKGTPHIAVVWLSGHVWHANVFRTDANGKRVVAHEVTEPSLQRAKAVAEHLAREVLKEDRPCA